VKDSDNLRAIKNEQSRDAYNIDHIRNEQSRDTGNIDHKKQIEYEQSENTTQETKILATRTHPQIIGWIQLLANDEPFL